MPKNYIIAIAILFFLSPSAYGATAHTPSFWNLEPPVLADGSMDGIELALKDDIKRSALDQAIARVIRIHEKKPDRVEPVQWLARLYFHRATHSSSAVRQESGRESKRYALLAEKMDPASDLSLKLLAVGLPFIGENDPDPYNGIITAKLPLGSGFMLPEPDLENWPQIKGLLMKDPLDIDPTIKANSMLAAAAAADPKGSLLQLWCSYLNYMIGHYLDINKDYPSARPYFSLGAEYAQKALDHSPQSVPAQFWYQANIASYIKRSNVLVQFRYLKTLYSHLVFCARNNPVYDYFGPSQTLAQMMVYGGPVARKGMEWIGITPEILIGQLNFARRIYPYALSNHMAQARLYIVLNEPAKAKGLLAEIIKTDPNADPWLAFSNHLTIVEAKETLDDLRAEAGK